MKPSERINQIRNENEGETDAFGLQNYIEAIMEYLDELYAKGLLIPEEDN